MAKVAILIRKIGDEGGAHISMLTLSSYLNEQNSVGVFAHGESQKREYVKHMVSGSIKLPHQATTMVRFFEYYLRMRSCLLEFDPDIICSQLGASYLGYRLSTELNVPHVQFFHDPHFIFKNIFKSENNRIIGQILDYFSSPVNRIVAKKIIKNADVLIANSQHTADLYKNNWNVDPAVVYPFVNTSQYKVKNVGKRILHVNPAKHKGIDITIEIARENPQHNFLIVGRAQSKEIRNELAKVDNISYVGHINNIKDAYKKTKVVLMPSRKEPFGRIPVEAGCSGIPTIASQRGGLPESVGINELLVHSSNANSYTDKLKEVLSNYSIYSDLVKMNAELKKVEAQVAKFSDIVRKNTDIDISV